MKRIVEESPNHSPLDNIHPRVREIPGYTLRAIQAEVKINQNENPFDFPPDLKESVFNRMRQLPWSRYPEFVPRSLIQKIASRLDWKEEGILVGNGSNELIQSILMVALDRSKQLLLPRPTFTLYRLVAGILGANLLEVPLNENLEFDVEGICSTVVTEHPAVILICSPNNPTGCQLSEAELDRILRVHRGLLVLDEAYCEFAPRNMLNLLKDHSNLLITRTFSKAAGIAGLRVGYCLGDPALIAQISKAKLPYSVNIFSLTAAEILFDSRDQLERNVQILVTERRRMQEELRRIPGVRPYDSNANFIFFRIKENPQEVFTKLLHRNILIRDVSRYPLLEDGLRVSIGTPQENNRFLSALSDILAPTEAE